VRHTAAAISLMLALIFVVSGMSPLIPGLVGDWIEKLMPGNAGPSIATPVDFNPNLLDAWTGDGVFLAETAIVVAVAWALLRRRDVGCSGKEKREGRVSIGWSGTRPSSRCDRHSRSSSAASLSSSGERSGCFSAGSSGADSS